MAVRRIEELLYKKDKIISRTVLGNLPISIWIESLNCLFLCSGTLPSLGVFKTQSECLSFLNLLKRKFSSVKKDICFDFKLFLPPFPMGVGKPIYFILNNLQNHFRVSKLGKKQDFAYRPSKAGGGGNVCSPNTPFWGYVSTISRLPNIYIGKQARNGNGKRVIHRCGKEG